MITNPPQQRALRGHMPRRVSFRAANSGTHQAQLAARLTPRDRWVARILWEHKVFTTHQLVSLAWPSPRAANLRLRELFCWRVLDRFQPFVTSGSAPMHYVLDTAGASVLAAEDGLSPKDLGFRHEASIGLAHSLRLAHTVGVNAFFSLLVARSRTDPGAGALSAWWSESRCRQHFGDLVRPDAYGRWREGDIEVEFFLEFDFGTEVLKVLASKVRDYYALASASGIPTPVLAWMPTSAREASARRALGTALAELDKPNLVPIATTAADFIHDLDPSAARWLPLTNTASTSARRLYLADLPARSTRPKSSSTAVPIPPTPSPPMLNPPSPLPPPESATRGRRPR